MLFDSFVKVATVKPKYEVADVFRRYGVAYRRQYPVSWEQHKAMRDIVNCRTAALGGYVEEGDGVIAAGHSIPWGGGCLRGDWPDARRRGG